MVDCRRLAILVLWHSCILCYVEGTSLTQQIQQPRTLVIGGFDAALGKFPYGQVSLFMKDHKHQCGGTVIARDMIMTAGHCSDVFDTVEIGEYDRKDAANKASIQTFRPVRKILHPLYELSLFRFDVLLIKLDRPIENIEPIRLNSNPRIPRQSSSSLTLIGWGSTNYVSESRDRIFPSVLQQASVPYVDNNVCEMSEFDGKQQYKDEIFDEMLCAGRTGIDACRGDSGSPLILENSYYNGADLQVGLVSWGRGCGKYPGVYTRISVIFPWIRARVCWHSAHPPAYLACRSEEQSPALKPSAQPSAPLFIPPSPLGVASSPKETKETNNVLGSEESDPIAAEEIPLPDSLWNKETTSNSTRPKSFDSIFCLVLSFTALPLFWLLG